MHGSPKESSSIERSFAVEGLRSAGLHGLTTGRGLSAALVRHPPSAGQSARQLSVTVVRASEASADF